MGMLCGDRMAKLALTDRNHVAERLPLLGRPTAHELGCCQPVIALQVLDLVLKPGGVRQQILQPLTLLHQPFRGLGRIAIGSQQGERLGRW